MKKIDYEESAIQNISKIADGSMRDALSITEQCISHGDNKITYENICKILCLMPVENINQVINMLVKEEIDQLIDFIDKLYYQSVDFKYLLQEIISIFHQTAIFKVTNKINDSIYDNSIKILSEKYNEEEVQILYQIGVSNLKDLEYAPDFKSGFEMTIIRILLFTPFNFENSSSGLSDNTKSNISSSNEKKITKKENFIEKKSDKKNIQKNEYLSVEKNWDIIVKRLEIDSMTKNLASNISFDSKNNNNLNFLVSKELIGMVTEKSKAKLQEALSSFLKNEMLINISVSDSLLTTIHKKNEAENKIKLAKADEKMKNDDFVKTIKEKFGATSIDDSIKINDKKTGE